MRLQVLVVTRGQNDHRLLSQMNLQSYAVFGNQCGRHISEIFCYNGYTIRYESRAECGVGFNRNTVWMYADADICLFADDDVRYWNGYTERVLAEFARHPEADVILFNFHSTNPKRQEYQIPKWTRVHWYNALRYGTYRIAVRTARVQQVHLAFSLLFGGGARYGSGEDTIFLHDCCKRGLRIYASPLFLGEVSHLTSTWFEGYTPKFFHDKGALLAHLFPRLAKPFGFLLLLRHPEFLSNGLGFQKAYQYLNEGIQEYLGRPLKEVSHEKTADLRQQ